MGILEVKRWEISIGFNNNQNTAAAAILRSKHTPKQGSPSGLRRDVL
jgi:hypothetical protein